MSTSDFRSKKLNKNEARKLISKITAKFPARIYYSKHALEELINDNLTVSDVLNVIKSSDAKIVDEPELINGTYRYRLTTKRIGVVIAFNSNTSFVVVTAWRKQI